MKASPRQFFVLCATGDQGRAIALGIHDAEEPERLGFGVQELMRRVRGDINHIESFDGMAAFTDLHLSPASNADDYMFMFMAFVAAEALGGDLEIAEVEQG
ncbi:MAG TPA: hypothetical protein VK445_05350 [Dissulfurispiraceae bacterium]|nr:hypothetical protein [Dissulfurispiraceae bacterium]